ncbi:putative ABC transport system permease protein [Pontibacter ummariensis]|uniref:Putative ABC transport system permease protein n=1 Tax=Pontibacter ummariensis TaxID=1610492 RepID=A0A239BPK1_9BACT|nr:ABC transporter permease [Pontibacter ummariensis]PRY15711.1 putative ABC transport system permease protein [Pontibacter ummariensis]SNS09592.1 putative ABC transport system permease protein [Pontibacter ummariensis]
MNLIENILEGLRAIQGNLLRTVLTGLIISIGIMSLVGILTAVDSMKYSLTQTFSNLGANSFDIRRKGNDNRGSRGGRVEKVYPQIDYRQATQYKERMSEKALVSLSAYISGATVVKSETEKTNPNINIVAGDANYLANNNLNLAKGRDFSNFEQEMGVNVAIIGDELATNLFKNRDPLGQYITFLGRRFKIVGQLEKEGSSMGGSGDRRIIIPLETGRQIPQTNNAVLNYDIKTAIPRPEELNYVMGEATGIMRSVRQDPLGQEASFEIRRSDSMVQRLDEISGYLKVGGFVIGFITLLGASVGLMNIMMVSVNERTREIGVRKALGATSHQIRQQFLIEAVVICLLGGLVGIILGILMGNGIASLIGEGGFIVPWLWVVVGLSICVLVGVVSGYYPAFRASKLDPIESLRYE